MIGSNGSLSGHPTTQRAFAWSESAGEETRLGALLIASILFINSQPKSPLLRFLRALHLAALLLCRHEIFTLMLSSRLHSAYVYAAVALGIQYSLAAINGSHDGGSSSLKLAPPSLPPLIFPCHTSHMRVFPSRHSFTYSYLLVGIPIGWQHDAGLLSCDPDTTSRSKSWFSVHAEDYLARGGCQGGLRAKLDTFLLKHGVQPNEYPSAYLVTAPRFLGWNFNPVSFWYLYNHRRKLKAMILEVNNTFDERRMYLLQPTASSDDDKFREKWQKDFHVSPFNDRLGDYSLLARDPFETDSTSDHSTRYAEIDNTITLLSPGADAKTKIVARVNSTSASIDPSSLSTIQAASFMIQWCWTGFLTNPRILREAQVLWMKKKLQLFYRPEINVGSIGRQETSEETVLEVAFRKWLESLASSRSLRIGYISAAGPMRGQRTVIDSIRDLDEPAQGESADFVLEILTPEWYSELARSRDAMATFNTKCFVAAEGEGMATVSESGRRILEEALSSSLDGKVIPTPLQTFSTALIQPLRQGTSLLRALLQVGFMLILRPQASWHGDTVSFSDLLYCVGGCNPKIDSVTMRILLADRLALGFTGLLKLYGQVIWAFAIYLSAREYRWLLLGYRG